MRRAPTWRKYCDIDEAYCDDDVDHEEHEYEDVCDAGLELPTLPAHKYFAVLEGNDMVKQQTHALKVWYNYDANEYRSEYYHSETVVVTLL